MQNVELCSECGVPMAFAMAHQWLSDGDIVVRLNPAIRVGFLECGNIDPTFRRIGEIIGHPIDHLVLHIVARGSELYGNSLLPQEVRDMVRERKVERQPVVQTILESCHLIGYGRYEYLGDRYEGDENDYAKLRIHEPFSVLEAAGAIAGITASLVGGEHSVTVEEKSPGVYEFSTHWTTYPAVLRERLVLEEYHARPGDLELESCSTCGTPRAVGECRWDLERGTITNSRNGYRMAILGPGLMDVVFEALEWELGETIPRTVVDAQRQLVREGFRPLDFTRGAEDLRVQLAMRGLGNLREFRMDGEGAYLHLDTSCYHLPLVGLLQGSFEALGGVDSHADWEIGEDRSLRVEVRTAA